jgi:hypothetical protein
MLGPILWSRSSNRNSDRGPNADAGRALLAAIAPDDPHVVENRIATMAPDDPMCREPHRYDGASLKINFRPGRCEARDKRE